MWPAWLRRPAPLPFGYELKGTATHDRLEVPPPPSDRVRHHVFHLPLGSETRVLHLPDPDAQHRFHPGRQYALAVHANLNWAWFRDQALRLSQSVAEDRVSPAPKDFSLLTACVAGPPRALDVTLKTGDQLFTTDVVAADARYFHHMTFCRAGHVYTFASAVKAQPLEAGALFTAHLRVNRSEIWFQGQARPVSRWTRKDD